MKRVFSLSTVLPWTTFFLAGQAGVAWACGECMNGYLWQGLPMIRTWSLLIAGWYLVLSTLKSLGGLRLPGVPGPIGSAVVLFVAWLIGLGSFGLLPVLAFLVPCLIGWTGSLAVHPSRPVESRCLWAIRISGLVAAALLSVTAVSAYREAAQMTTADVIMMWDGTPTGRSLMSKLMQAKGESTGECRKLLREGNGYYLKLAALHLADYGNPDTDIPLVIEAIDRVRRSGDENRWTARELEKVLRESTKLDVPQDSPGDAWRAAWKKRTNTSPAPAPSP